MVCGSAAWDGLNDTAAGVTGVSDAPLMNPSQLRGSTLGEFAGYWQQVQGSLRLNNVPLIVHRVSLGSFLWRGGSPAQPAKTNQAHKCFLRLRVTWPSCVGTGMCSTAHKEL